MMKGVNLRLNATNKAGPAMASFRKGMRGIKTAQDSVRRSNVGFMKGMNSNRRIIQQVGMQVSDLGVQIAGGQSAILSLTQNVPQVVQMFGAWGGILAAVITLIGTFTLVMIKSGKGINDIIPFMGALSDEFSTLARAVGVAKEAILDGLNLVINNLDVLFISLSIIAAFMVKRWVMSFLTATGTLRLFNTALLVTQRRGVLAGLGLLKARAGALLFGKAMVFVKKVLISTGIGALIVGTGYLIERLLTLKKATGSWGETFKLVGDVTKQTLTQLVTIFAGVSMKIRQRQLEMSTGFVDMLGDMLAGVGDWANPVIGVFVGIRNAIGEIFNAIGPAIVNPIVGGINNVITKARDGINTLIQMANHLPSINIPVIPPNMGKIGEVTVTDTRKLGERVSKAFKDGLGGTYVGENGVLTKGMRDASDRTKNLASQVGKLGDRMLKSASDAIPAWKELKRLLSSTDANDFDIRSIMGGKKGDPITDLPKKIKDMSDVIQPIVLPPADTDPVIDSVSDALKSIKKMGESIGQTMKESFKGLIRGTKSFKQVMLDTLNVILDKMLDVILNPIFDSVGGAIAGGIGGLLGNIASFNGGGHTGNGVRVGGMDGKGGKLAVVHPNETVVDHTKGSGVRQGGLSRGVTNNFHFNSTQVIEGAISSEDIIEIGRAQQKQTIEEVRQTVIPMIQQQQADGGV